MKVAVVLLFLAFATAGVAQEVIVGPLRLLPAVPGTETPEIKGRFRPTFPNELRNTPEIGYVVAARHNDERGRTIAMQLIGTHIPFQRAVEEIFHKTPISAARRDGSAVTARVWLPIIFNPKSSAGKQPDATPRLLSVTPIVTVRSPTAANTPPLARVRIELDAAGAVVSVKPLHEIASATAWAIEAQVKEWKFAPARKAGNAVASEVTMFVICQPPWRDDGPEIVPPRPKRRAAPNFPVAMEQYGFSGDVTLEFIVDEKGKVQNPVIKDSSNPGFNDAALEAMRKSTFDPGTRDGKPVAMSLTTTIKFQHPFNNEQFGVKEARARRDVPENLRFDTPPKLRGLVPPVYPHALRTEKVRGSATVLIMIDSRGGVSEVQAVESTHPEFALAAKAAAESYAFDPATRDGKVVPSVIKHTQKFDLATLADPVADRLVKWERDGSEKIVDARRLDAPIKPISRARPVFPHEHRVKGTLTGKAVVEVLIDDEGNARLPRILSATEEAFGYAAAQAVSLWKFDPPRLNGKAVVTRVEVPFSFRLEPD